MFWYALGAAGFNRNAVRIPYAPAAVRRMQTGGSGGMTGLGGHDVCRTSELARRGKVPEDWWSGIGAGSHMPKSERVGYPTQKPLALLDRIIKASSNEGDFVLDPFCGCATACVSAEKLGRQWVGIDLSDQAAPLVKRRLRAELPQYQMFEQVHDRTDLPRRTDLPHGSAAATVDKRPGWCSSRSVPDRKPVSRRVKVVREFSGNHPVGRAGCVRPRARSVIRVSR